MRDNLAALREANGMSVTTPSTELPIRLTDGAVAIGGRPVLRHIDLEVRPGEFVALWAPTARASRRWCGRSSGSCP